MLAKIHAAKKLLTRARHALSKAIKRNTVFKTAAKKAAATAKKLKDLKHMLLAHHYAAMKKMKKFTIKTPSRSAKLVAATMTGYKGANKHAGECLGGNCCITSYSDATCKLKVSKMCKKAFRSKKDKHT